MASEASDTVRVTDEDNAGARTSKFRFKTKSRHHEDRASSENDRKRHGSKRPRGRSRSRSPDRRSGHRHKRHRSMERSKGEHVGTYLREHRSEEDDTPEQRHRDAVRDALADEEYLNPQQAFRESLFDALADDEGASYWQELYGQPIHVYGREKAGPEGKLEQMTDDEYASYVRTQMYEKTHQYLSGERQRREEARKEQKQREKSARRTEARHDDFQARIAESLRKREVRRNTSRWKDPWKAYRSKWERLVISGPGTDSVSPRKLLDLPWPVETGNVKHISKDSVEEFIRHCPEDIDTPALLKAERVRWHPDKIQQRFGGKDIGSDTLKSVTAVFQILDHMWNDMKQK